MGIGSFSEQSSGIGVTDNSKENFDIYSNELFEFLTSIYEATVRTTSS